jgi:hypothetical protein
MVKTKVKIIWNWLDWQPGHTWGRNILPQLSDLQIQEQQLYRCVYVVRANGMFAIQYPNGISPTLYIGEGNFKNRIIQHKNWLRPLIELVGEFSFQVGICFPRVKKNFYAYQDFEAALLIEFRDIYGCAPLKNLQMEKRRANYEYVSREEVKSAIMIGKGVRYHWALVPMKSSPFHDSYWKTHIL